MRRALLALVVWIALAVSVSAQTGLAPRTLSVGAAPTPPDSSTTVRITGLATSGTGEPLFTDSDGDMFRRALGKSDLPAVVGYLDEAETWALLQTFTSGITSNGLVTIGGANDLLLGTGGLRAPSGSILLRNIADSANIATFGDSAITLVQPVSASSTLGVTGATTLSSTLGVTGLSTLTGGFTSSAASQVNSTLGITGLTTAALIKTTGVYGVAAPLTLYASDGTTARVLVDDAGKATLTDTGTASYLQYTASGATSGQRQWRMGITGSNFLAQGGNDAGGSWANLFRSTMTAGTPNGWYWGTGVRSVTPDQDFTTDLGAYPTQYGNLWVRNLWATTLVAQDVISTIGGAVNVAPTTYLEADIASGDTTITTHHNEMVVDDIAYLNANLGTEFMRVTAGPIAGASSLSYVAKAEAVGTTVTIPAHQVGDLLVIFAFRNAATAPSLPAGWTNACNDSGGSTSARVGYTIADTTSETSGTWTNATALLVHVYRSTTGFASAPGACAWGNASASTTLTYPALTLSKTDHSSWVARAAMASAGTNIQSAPTGYTLRGNNTAVPESASFDSNGRITATSVAASAGLTITSGNWRAVSLEIVGIGLAPFSYTVTRGYGGAFAARAWSDGDALMNTGGVGDGFINMYAIQSIKGSGEQGPTISGNERISTTYDGWETRWSIGNLRGLWNFGATDIYGAAFGDPSDVWLTANDVDGVKFYDAGTTLNAHFALDGSILLGQTGSGQANTSITSTALKLRRGTVDYVDLSSAGLVMGDGTNTRVTLDATNGLVLGRTTSGHGNTAIDTTGNLYLRSGTVNRIGLAASNGSLTLYDDDGTTARVRVTSTQIYMYDQAEKPYFYIDAASGVLFGDWSTAGKPYINATPGGVLYFCAAGTACTLELNGANGNITSTGSITLGSAGHIKSGATAYATGTGFWLGDDSGTKKFYVGNGTGGSSNYLTWNGSALSVSGALIAQSDLTLGSSANIVKGSGGLTMSATGVGAGVTISAGGGAGALTLTAGSLIAGGNTAITATKTVRDSAGTGACTLIFTLGVLTGGTC